MFMGSVTSGFDKKYWRHTFIADPLAQGGSAVTNFTCFAVNLDITLSKGYQCSSLKCVTIYEWAPKISLFATRVPLRERLWNSTDPERF